MPPSSGSGRSTSSSTAPPTSTRRRSARSPTPAPVVEAQFSPKLRRPAVARSTRCTGGSRGGGCCTRRSRRCSAASVLRRIRRANAVLEAIAIQGGDAWLSIDWDLWDNAGEAKRSACRSRSSRRRPGCVPAAARREPRIACARGGRRSSRSPQSLGPPRRAVRERRRDRAASAAEPVDGVRRAAHRDRARRSPRSGPPSSASSRSASTTASSTSAATRCSRCRWRRRSATASRSRCRC